MPRSINSVKWWVRYPNGMLGIANQLGLQVHHQQVERQVERQVEDPVLARVWHRVRDQIDEQLDIGAPTG